MDSKKRYELLWTGGWDSTFRLIELSRMENVCVQPVYVVDPNRASVEYERRSMNQILIAIEKKTETKAEILPLIVYSLADIPADPQITDAFAYLYSKSHIGGQYEWLARLSTYLHPRIEVCVEKPKDTNSGVSGFHRAINLFGKMEFEDGIGYINREESSEEVNLVLGNLTYPTVTKSAVEMQEIIKIWGYEDVMSHIWFCHTPVNGEQCGLCHPCQQKMESDMEWLLSEAAQRRFYRYKKIQRMGRLGKYMADYYVKIQRKMDESICN